MIDGPAAWTCCRERFCHRGGWGNSQMLETSWKRVNLDTEIENARPFRTYQFHTSFHNPSWKNMVHFSCNQVLYSETGLSFWGGVSPKSGVVVDRHHPLCGQHLNGKILAIPAGRGRVIPFVGESRDVWCRCLGKSRWAWTKKPRKKRKGRSQWYDIYTYIPIIYQWGFNISDDSIHNSQSIWTLFLLYRFCRWWGVFITIHGICFTWQLWQFFLHDLFCLKELLGFEFWHDGSDDQDPVLGAKWSWSCCWMGRPQRPLFAKPMRSLHWVPS